MNRRHTLRLASMAVCLLLSAAPAAAVRVEEVADPRATRNGWVTDMAGLLSPAVIDTLDALAAALAERTGAQMAFAVVPEIGEVDARTFATALFQRWGVGRAGVDDGLLVLVVSEARRIEVETGYGLEGVLPDGRVGSILDRSVVPAFRAGDWGQGLVAGARAFAATIIAGPEALAAEAAAQAAERARRRGRARAALVWIVGLVTALFASAAAIHSLRFCPRCRRLMRHFDDRADDAWLSVAERLEETMGSIDHRIWRCDACGILTVEHARRPFSPVEDCPDCHRRTVRVERVTLRPATTSREGRAEVTRACQNTPCGYRDKRTEDLPRIATSSTSGGSSGGGSSSSSGGSFGGGRSGGGGAGRGW